MNIQRYKICERDILWFSTMNNNRLMMFVDTMELWEESFFWEDFFVIFLEFFLAFVVISFLNYTLKSCSFEVLKRSLFTKMLEFLAKIWLNLPTRI